MSTKTSSEPVVITAEVEVLGEVEIGRTPAERALNPLLSWGLMALLAFAVIAFGTVETWSIFALECGATLLLLLWAGRQIVRKEINIIPQPLMWPALGFAALAVAQIVFGRTAYAYATYLELWKYAAYAILMFLATQRLRRTNDLTRFGITMTIFGAAVAMFAILQSLTGTEKIYWLRTITVPTGIFGPYVNHNHFAGLMEMLLGFPLVLWMVEKWKPSTRLLLAFAAVLMASSIFLSRSRGGMTAFAGEVLVLGLVLARRRERESRMPLVLMAAATIVLLVWLGGGTLAQRIATLQTPADEGVAGLRLVIARDSLHLVAARPVLGWGLGAFPYVFPQFRTFPTELFVNHAHNDYLELVTETGMVGAGLVLWFLVVLVRRGLSKARYWRSSPGRAVGLAAFLGCIGLLVHSLTDYNLHIPANAAMFFVLCAVASNKSSDSGAVRTRQRVADTEDFE